MGRITVHVLKVVREAKQDGQGQTGRNSHNQNVSDNVERKSLGLERRNDVAIDVKSTQGNGVLSALSDVRIVEIHSNGGGSTLFQREDFHVEDRRQPVTGQHKEVIKGLELVHEGTLLVAGRIIVPEQHGLGSVTVGVISMVIGVGMVRPVLFHPQPFAASDEIGSESKKLVDPGFLGGCSVVGVVLNIQTDKRLRDTVDHSHGIRGNAKYPVVLHSEKEADVKECTSKPSPSSELFSGFHNLENFLLDFTLEFGVPLVSGRARNKDEKVSVRCCNSSMVFVHGLSRACLPRTFLHAPIAGCMYVCRQNETHSLL
jgi:hypothetical protein